MHIGLLLLAVAPFVFLFFQSRRLVRLRDAFLLTAAMLLAPPLLLIPTLDWPDEIRGFVIGYLIFFECATLLALGITTYGLMRQKRAKQIVAFFGGLLLLAIAIGLLLPAVPTAREAARRMQCSNNLKMLSLALLYYEADSQFLPAAVSQLEPETDVSWRVQLLPFIEREQLFRQYDRTLPWDSQINAGIAKINVPTYVCPSNPIPQNQNAQFYTAYCMALGPETPLQRSKPMPMPATASTSQSIALVEACGTNIVWTEPRDANMSTQRVGVNLPGSIPHTSGGIISSYHTGGANTAMLDGSIHFLSEEIDADVLQRLLSAESTKPQ